MAELIATSGNATVSDRSREEDTLPKLQFISEETAIRTVAAVMASHDSAAEATPPLVPQYISATDPVTTSPEVEAVTSLLDIEESQHDSGKESDVAIDSSVHSRLLRSATYDETITVHGDPGGFLDGSGTTIGGGGNDDYVPISDGETIAIPKYDVNHFKGTTKIKPSATLKDIPSTTITVHGHTHEYIIAPDGHNIATFQNKYGEWQPLLTEYMKSTLDEITNKVFGRNSVDSDISPAHQLTETLAVGSHEFESRLKELLAHTQEAHEIFSRIIAEVLDRPPNSSDEPWIRAKQDSLGRGETTLQDVRSGLTNEADAIRQAYRDAGGIEPNAKQVSDFVDYLHRGGTVQGALDSVINVHGPDAIRHAYRDWGGIEPNGDQVSGFMDYLHRGGTVQGMRDPIVNVHGPDAIRHAYRDWGGIEPNGDQVSGFMDYLHRGGTIQGMRDPIVNVHGPDAIRHAYRDWGGIEPNGDQVSGFMDYLHRGGTVQGMRDPIVNVHGPDAIRHAYRDWGGIEPNGDQVFGFMDYLHRGGTVQGMRDPIVNVHGPDAIRQAYRDAGGIEPNAKQVGDFVDYLRRGGTVQGARGPIAQVHGGDSANHYANTILGHDLSSEQRAQYVDRLAHGAKQSDITYDIVHSASGQRIVQEFVSRYYGVDVDGLSASASNLLSNLAISSHSLMGMTFDSIRQLGEQLQITPGVGNVLDYLSPKDSSDWLKLAAASVTLAVGAGLLVTPAGEVLVAADLVLVGGAAMLGRAGMILESRFVRETSTGHTSSGKPTKIVDSTGKEHAIEHIANTNAQHSAKHINDAKYPNFSLSKVGINSVSDIARYIKETLTNALSHPERYEVFEDMPRDTLGVWDNKNQQATLFQPKPGANDGNFGTTVRPEAGKEWLMKKVKE
ncbi:hypothetical protein ABHV46_11055 [Asaia sp. BMEF1]|uniref:hypothetical protein n=1 Tax=Asaia sp. BMEF1 TaxID=3155932 RepID=UPI003F6760E3